MSNSTTITTVPSHMVVTQEQIVTATVIGSLLLSIVVMNVVMFAIYKSVLRSQKTRQKEKHVSNVLLLQINPTASVLITRNSITDYGHTDIYRKLDIDSLTSSMNTVKQEDKPTIDEQNCISPDQKVNSCNENVTNKSSKMKTNSIIKIKSCDTANQSNSSFEVEAEIEIERKDGNTLTKDENVSGSLRDSDNDSTNDLQFIDEMRNMSDMVLGEVTKEACQPTEFQNEAFEQSDTQTVTDTKTSSDEEHVRDIKL